MRDVITACNELKQSCEKAFLRLWPVLCRYWCCCQTVGGALADSQIFRFFKQPEIAFLWII